ncbi:MAG: PilZ domain-containing protein [Proteobacteria bacterium]|nr:PilZ domain-containing protein [Pseudomonadota bacterium]
MLAPTTNIAEKRRYPRLDWEQTGSLDLNEPGGERISVPIVIRSVSPEGLGVATDAGAELPGAGRILTINFKIGQRDISLPGRVMWLQRSDRHNAVGIRLVLELARASMRQAFASWIVDRLGRALSHRRSTPRRVTRPRCTRAVVPRTSH